VTTDRLTAAPAALRRHLELLGRWNDRVDLVSPARQGVWWDRHFEDSLGALAAVPAGPRRVVDVGSGAGFPGLVWSLARPDLHLTLVEPRGKRATFLRSAARHTGSSAVVLTERAGALAPGDWDVVVGRAVAPYARWLEIASPLARPDGLVLAMLTPTVPEGWGVAEAAQGLALAGQTHYVLPGTGARRRVAVLRKLVGEVGSG